MERHSEADLRQIREECRWLAAVALPSFDLPALHSAAEGEHSAGRWLKAVLSTLLLHSRQ